MEGNVKFQLDLSVNKEGNFFPFQFSRVLQFVSLNFISADFLGVPTPPVKNF